MYDKIHYKLKKKIVDVLVAWGQADQRNRTDSRYRLTNRK